MAKSPRRNRLRAVGSKSRPSTVTVTPTVSPDHYSAGRDRYRRKGITGQSPNILVSLQPIHHWIDSTWRPNQQATSDTNHPALDPIVPRYPVAFVKTRQWTQPSHHHSSSRPTRLGPSTAVLATMASRHVYWREAMIGGEAHPRQKDGSLPKRVGGQSARQGACEQ
jgi:hypothetical protein